MKDGHYLTHYFDIDEAHLAHLTGADEGAPRLKVDLYYYKEGKRGLKLCVTRMRVGERFETASLMEACNAYMHVLSMPRKNDKVGRAAAAEVEKWLPEIKRVALEGDRPDFQGLLNRLTPAVRAATGQPVPAR